MQLPLIDTHCHLDLLQDKAHCPDWASLRALIQPLPELMIQVACHPDTFGITETMLADADIYGTFGVHPHDASLYTDAVEVDLQRRLTHPKAVGIGEMGLDYHYDFSPRDVQKQVFARQLALGLRHGKPIVLHTREADADTMEILRAQPLQGAKIHVHCYTGSLEFAKQLIALDAEIFFGFTGVISFKTADEIRQVLAWLPEDRLLTETDSPYLAPIPHRGKNAHPGMVELILRQMAQVRNCLEMDLAQTVRANAKRCYGV